MSARGGLCARGDHRAPEAGGACPCGVVTVITAPVSQAADPAAALARVEALIDPAARLGYGMWGARLFSERAIRDAIRGTS